MDLSNHNMTNLFNQLGLPSDEASIQQFIRDNSPIPADQPIYEASCFTDVQAAFLAQGLDEDSDWSEVIDTLHSAMSESPQSN